MAMANAGSFKKGEKRLKQGKRGPGKATKALKDAILAALDAAHAEGSVAYLTQQAKDNPSAFMTLIGKVLPLQVTGEGGGPIIVVTGVERG